MLAIDAATRRRGDAGIGMIVTMGSQVLRRIR
jgi:hypothetical protein